MFFSLLPVTPKRFRSPRKSALDRFESSFVGAVGIVTRRLLLGLLGFGAQGGLAGVIIAYLAPRWRMLANASDSFRRWLRISLSYLQGVMKRR
ncbi:MAG TPA: hypothetical protein VN879_02855, partial [Candidatus Acidoferrales bacterium]|nr:hypothetical protein [Candidatus Acidoferrales bacterium]